MGPNIQELYHTYKYCLARIETTSPEGDIHNGTGFTVGNGLIVTAAHVLDYRLNGVTPYRRSHPVVVHRIHRHADPTVDLAVIETDFTLEKEFDNVSYHYPGGSTQSATERHRKFIPIGDHLDDWIGDELILCEVLLLGYPRIPFADSPVLTVTTGHVNAILDRYNGKHPYFIVSCTARGGFSGGPAITEYGALLGVISSSFVHNDQELELGFNGVITIEPLLNLLADAGLKPAGVNDELWGSFTGG